MTQAARSRTRRVVPHPGPVAPAAPAALPPAPPAAPAQGALPLPEVGAAEWRRQKEKFDALLRQLDYERAAGQVVPVAEVEALHAETGAMLRAELEGFGARLAPQLIGCDEATCRVRLDEEVHAVLRNVEERARRRGAEMAGGAA